MLRRSLASDRSLACICFSCPNSPPTVLHWLQRAAKSCWISSTLLRAVLAMNRRPADSTSSSISLPQIRSSPSASRSSIPHASPASSRFRVSTECSISFMYRSSRFCFSRPEPTGTASKSLPVPSISRSHMAPFAHSREAPRRAGAAAGTPRLSVKSRGPIRSFFTSRWLRHSRSPLRTSSLRPES